MAVEYPDIMNDALDARKRYESGAVQYLADIPTQPVPAGEVVRVALLMESVMDVPVQIALHIALPELTRKLRRLDQPLFQIFQPDITLTLSNGEAAELIIPIHIKPHVPPETYRFAIHVRAQATQQGMRVRAERNSATDYIASLDFSFQPRAIRALLQQEGLPFVELQAPAVAVIPVSRAAPGTPLREDPAWTGVWK